MKVIIPLHPPLEKGERRVPLKMKGERRVPLKMKRERRMPL